MKNSEEFSTMEFGNYYQSSQDSKEPIEWIILEERGNSLLLLSKYALDLQPYNTDFVDVTWETCTLRKWLNDTFLGEAFSPEEQKMINTTKVTADENPQWDTPAGNDTNDKVFVLGATEADQYFSSDNARACQGTAQCGWGKNDPKWWLRSPGYHANEVMFVYGDGSIEYDGDSVRAPFTTVRPALWVTLE